MKKNVLLTGKCMMLIHMEQNNLLSKKFGKDEGFTVGLVLLPFIFLPILGFGSSEYKS